MELKIKPIMHKNVLIPTLCELRNCFVFFITLGIDTLFVQLLQTAI